MKYLTLIFLIPVLCFGQADSVHNLGPVYESFLQQQEALKKQYEEGEKLKQAFILGYFEAKGKTLTAQDSLVFVEPNKVKILTKKKDGSK